MALPAIAACGRWRIEADVLWGKERRPVTFRAAGAADQVAPRAAVAADPSARRCPTRSRRCSRGWPRARAPWVAAPATVILDLPGAGLCVPDLVFTPRRGPGAPVYLEVLGFWSREAVWRRVELVERGLPHRILFAVSKHLRVSEAALDDELPGSLYVYARTLDARAILERVERLAARAIAGGASSINARKPLRDIIS